MRKSPAALLIALDLDRKLLEEARTSPAARETLIAGLVEEARTKIRDSIEGKILSLLEDIS